MAPNTPVMRSTLPLALFFLSGFTGLFLEVLWMRHLRLLLGSAAQSISLTLAVFFLGMALGNRWWGNRAGSLGSGLRLYGLLEIAVAVSAFLLLGLNPAFERLYPMLFGWFGETSWGMIVAKLLLGAAFLLPPCFFMGGTYPAMTEALVRSRLDLGRGASLLYGINTLGGALGAFSAGFLALGWFGFQACYLFAATLAAAIGGVAWAISLREAPLRAEAVDVKVEPPPPPNDPNPVGPTWPTIRLLAFFSGFSTLAIEVLWTRMFEQVLHNSVYTFSLILVAFLVSLGLGGLVARNLAKRDISPSSVLVVLGCATGFATSISPFLFNTATNQLGYLGAREGWGGYLALVLGTLCLTVLGPGVLMGTMFPYLLKAAEPFTHSTGRTVGALTSLNTMGAVAGSLAGAFVFLEVFGLWNGIRAVSAIYFWLALWVGIRIVARNRMGMVGPVGGLACLLFLLDPSGLPTVKVSPGRKILQTWEGSAGTVAVVESSRTRSILLNNHYTLGGLLAKRYQETMSHIPLLAHPNPKSVFYVGMGTGITAGGSMLHPVEKVTVTELIPDAVEAARRYFREETQGLFEDPRVEIVVEDGRLFLASANRSYDLVVGDLFIPWQAGAGNLYSLDHYRKALERLRPGGAYAQWLPLYQVSEFELGTIARTMLEAFPALTLWRGDFFKDRSILLLLGHREIASLSPGRIVAGVAEMAKRTEKPAIESGQDFWGHYLGFIAKGDSPFEDFPINRDDRPIIEYTAPVTMRKERAGEVGFVRGREFLHLMEWTLAEDRIERDPFLAEATEVERAWIREGFEKHRAIVRGF